MKLRVGPLPGFASRIRSLGATLHRRRRFEDNFLLDTSDRRVGRIGGLLRIRIERPSARLTWKGPARIVGGTKTRTEVETGLGDGRIVLEILRKVGFEAVFRYQKYRTTYRYGRLLITLDETPIGNYAELEGTPGSIRRFASRLGRTQEEFITGSYRDLFLRYKARNRLRARDMVFGIKSSR